MVPDLTIRRVCCISNGQPGRRAARLAGDFRDDYLVVEPFDKSAKGKTTKYEQEGTLQRPINKAYDDYEPYKMFERLSAFEV